MHPLTAIRVAEINLALVECSAGKASVADHERYTLKRMWHTALAFIVTLLLHPCVNTLVCKCIIIIIEVGF